MAPVESGTVLVPLAWFVGSLIVEAIDPRRRYQERHQRPETPEERYRRNQDLIDHARQCLVDRAIQRGRK